MNKYLISVCTSLLLTLSACATTAEQSAGGVANNAQDILGVVWKGSEKPATDEEKSN